MSDCRKCVKAETCAVEEDCDLFVAKPQTKGDEIRAMSDEELAEMFSENSKRNLCCPNYGNCDCCASCLECWLDWLKSPAWPGEVEK